MALVEELGSDAFLHGSITDSHGEEVMLVARVDPTTPPEKGETVHLAPNPDRLHFFDAASGARLVG